LMLASALAVALGAHFSTPHLPPIVCMVLSFVWLIGCTNAVNLIDGMDGLATGVGLLATLTTLAVALMTHNVGLAIPTIPLAGCLIAFLFFNFSPATVFLGDCGSLTIGFALGCLGLIWSQHTGNLVGMAAPLVTFALPLIDVGLAIFRRFLRSRPIFEGDRGHIHHMILRSGVSTRAAAFILYGVCILFATLGLLLNFSRQALAWIVLGFFSCIVIVGIDRLGYVEFSAAARTISQRRIRKHVKEEIYLEELTRALAVTDSLEDWWHLACETCREVGFATFEVNFEGKTWQQQYVQHTGTPSCSFYLDMTEHRSLVLTTPPGVVPSRVMMEALERLQASFQVRALTADSVHESIARTAA
jgi:UDP-GlcNAc:undecaprenyl-phosphate GlcNAc-1-phosphate transferase